MIVCNSNAAGSSQPVLYKQITIILSFTKLKGKKQLLLRCSFLLQDYNIVTNHIKGKNNTTADCLSRRPI